MPLLKNLPSNKIAKIADVLEMVRNLVKFTHLYSPAHLYWLLDAFSYCVWLTASYCPVNLRNFLSDCNQIWWGNIMRQRKPTAFVTSSVAYTDNTTWQRHVHMLPTAADIHYTWLTKSNKFGLKLTMNGRRSFFRRSYSAEKSVFAIVGFLHHPLW